MRKTGMRWVWGLVMVLLGVVLLLDTMSVSDAHDILIRWWPVLIIILGFGKLINSEYFNGVFWLVIGGVICLFTSGYVPHNGNIWEVIWPIVLILIGLRFIFRPRLDGSKISKNDFVDSTAVFSGSSKKISSKDFKGSTVTAVFGGAKLDLRDATIAKDGATVNVSAVFGGVEILVQKKTPVKIDALAIFGGHDDKREMSEIDNSLPTITIVGEAIFGGIEIKD